MSKIKNSHLLRKFTIEERAHTSLDRRVSQILSGSGETRKVDEIIGKLNLESIEDEIAEQFYENHIEDWCSTSLENEDYIDIIHNLDQPSAITKLKTLAELQQVLVIDTQQKFWPDLSTSLQNCFIHSNTEIFLRTLKIHHQILAFETTFLDGFLSLLQSTFVLLNSHYFSSSVRLYLTLKLILKAQYVSNRFLLHANRRIINRLVTTFVEVFNSKTAFLALGKLDPKALWLKNFCYGGYTRDTFFKVLLEKGRSLYNFCLKGFILYLNEKSSSRLFTGYICVYIFKYQPNIFPIQLDNDVITKKLFVDLINSKLNEKNSSDFCNLLIVLFEQCPKLINIKLLDVFLENLNRKNNKVFLDNNALIVIVLTNYIRTKNPSLLYVIHYKLYKNQTVLPKNIVNFSQRIINLTGVMLEQRNCNYILFFYLKLSNCLYESHAVAHVQIKSKKFIDSLHNFYVDKVLDNKSNIPEIKLEILKLINQFYLNNYNQVINSTNSSIVSDLLDTLSIESFKSSLPNIVNSPIGFEIVQKKRPFKAYLKEVWAQEDSDYETADLFDFLVLVFILSLNSRAIIAVLSGLDCDKTSENKTVSFANLINKTLINESGEACEQHLGLLALKVITTNLDLLLHFQVAHRIQETFRNRLKEEPIIDAQTYLVGEMVKKFENVGILSEAKNETDIDEFSLFLEAETKHRDFGWILQARRSFKLNLAKIQCATLPLLLETIPKSYLYKRGAEESWPQSDSVHHALFPEDLAGISMIINFGLKSSLIESIHEKEAEEDLTLLIKQARLFAGKTSSSFINFDWFTGVIFLICAGSKEETQNCLMHLIQLPIGSILWVNNLNNEDESTEKFFKYLLVALETIGVSYNALKILEISPSLVVRFWLKQSFFNVLPVDEIVKFLVFCCLYPIDYCLYYFVELFVHLEKRICILAIEKSAEKLTQVFNLADFRLDNCIESIEKQAKKYRCMNKL